MSGKKSASMFFVAKCAAFILIKYVGTEISPHMCLKWRQSEHQRQEVCMKNPYITFLFFWPETYLCMHGPDMLLHISRPQACARPGVAKVEPIAPILQKYSHGKYSCTFLAVK